MANTEAGRRGHVRQNYVATKCDAFSALEYNISSPSSSVWTGLATGSRALKYKYRVASQGGHCRYANA